MKTRDFLSPPSLSPVLVCMLTSEFVCMGAEHSSMHALVLLCRTGSLRQRVAAPGGVDEIPPLIEMSNASRVNNFPFHLRLTPPPTPHHKMPSRPAPRASEPKAPAGPKPHPAIAQQKAYASSIAELELPKTSLVKLAKGSVSQ